MADGNQVPLGIVCEAGADREIAAGLADAEIVRSTDWIEPEVLHDYRRWQGLAVTDLFLKWSDVKTIAVENGISVHGHFEGLPAHPDGHTAAKALRLFLVSPAAPKAVILMRDSDDDTDR